MKYAFVDTLILLAAYLAAYLLRFDFATPPWGWPTVLLGALPAIALGWIGLLLFRCYAVSFRAITLRHLPRFLGAAVFTSACQLALRYAVVPDVTYVLIRPPASVALMAGAFSLLGLLTHRYLYRLQLRPVGIADLLGRDESEVNTPAVREGFRGRTVLITGAGGSIGSELAAQVLAAAPKRLILCDISEAALYPVHMRLSERPGTQEGILRPVVADCGNRLRMRDLLETERPDTVLHAAAYKHVPMMEFNPGEALRNNAIGTRILAEEAVRAGVGTFLLISTDKAIRPISAMGVSKRLAEIFVRDLADSGRTVVCAVRFGNVLGSSGSVVPRFREQIAKGGPVTVTDPRMTRYFMTIAEACGLVLQSALMAKGGEIFVLDMGKPMTILCLAETMIRLAGLRPYRDIAIRTVGIRPGEKLSEELGITAAHAERTGHARVFVGRIPQLPHDAAQALLVRCRALAEAKAQPNTATLQSLLNEEGTHIHEDV